MNTYHYVLCIHLLALFIGMNSERARCCSPASSSCALRARSSRLCRGEWCLRQGGAPLPGRHPRPSPHRPLHDAQALDVEHAVDRRRPRRPSLVFVQGAGIAEHTAKKLQAAMMANGPGPLGAEARRMRPSGALGGRVREPRDRARDRLEHDREAGLAESIAAVAVGYAAGARAARAPRRMSAPNPAAGEKGMH